MLDDEVKKHVPGAIGIPMVKQAFPIVKQTFHQNQILQDVLTILETPRIYQKLMTFIYCAEYSSAKESVRTGLGWGGIDKKTMQNHPDIHNFKTTQWIYHHSDMKRPSNEVMENIYKNEIIKKIQFGLYQDDE